MSRCDSLERSRTWIPRMVSVLYYFAATIPFVRTTIENECWDRSDSQIQLCIGRWGHGYTIQMFYFQSVVRAHLFVTTKAQQQR